MERFTGEAEWEAIRILAGKDDGYSNSKSPSWNMMTICTVGGVLFFNVITRQLEAAAHGNKQSKELLEAVYRELSVLGIVAFVIWSIQSSSYLYLSYDNKHLFEVIHMTLFLAAIFHSFFVVLVQLYSSQVSKRWDVYEDDEMKRYKELKQQHRRTAQALGLRHSTLKKGVGPLRQIWLWIRHPSLSRRLWQLSENVSYHALRSHFIKANQLPRNFRFAAYLKKCEQEVAIELAEVRESVWVGFILFVGVELYIKGIMGEAESSEDVRVLFLVSAAVVMLFAIAVHFKLAKIYRALLYSYTTTTDRRDDFMQFLSPDTNALTRQQDMFWLGKPDLMLTILQSLQFLLATMVALLIWFGVGEVNGLIIVAETLLSLGALCIYSVVLPSFIPRYTMVTHVGEMVDRHILTEALSKQKKAFRRRTLPPTLRQVNLLARLKSKEQESKRGILGWTRHILSGHIFREIMQVFLSVHFFLVAYNTDAIENDDFRNDAYTAECFFAGAALVIEFLTHAIAWRGALCFTGRFTYTAPNPSYPPLIQRGEHFEEQAKAMNVSVHSEPSGWRDVSNLRKRHSYNEPVRRCSIWAFFGATSDGRDSHGVVPPDAAVGFWRAIDALLVLAVAGATIATGLTTGTTRVVCHALQGLVLLRLVPLHLCPLPPQPGSENDGEHGEHHRPLNKKEREHVIEETLKLLRGQKEQHGHGHGHGHVKTDSTHSRDAVAPAAGTELNEKGGKNDGSSTEVDGVVVASAVLPRPHEDRTVDAAMMAAAGAEEKDDTGDVMLPSRQSKTQMPADIAKLGVAMALREACTAHPEVVTTHGPLSAPILRAMLGLDPHQTSQADNSEAFAIAAQAMTVGIPGGSLGGGRDVDMVVAPPSPPSSSSSSSDDSSSPRSCRGRQRSGVSLTSIRAGRLPSWLGGTASRHREEMLTHNNANVFDDTGDEGEAAAHMDAHSWRWVHPPEADAVAAAAAGDEEAPSQDKPSFVKSSGNERLQQATWHAAASGSRPHSSKGTMSRSRVNSAGSMPLPGHAEAHGRVIHASMHRSTKRRGATGRKGGSRAELAGVMASTKEDHERPVLSSFASSSGWGGAWSPGHGAGGGNGGGVPVSSFHRPSQLQAQAELTSRSSHVRTSSFNMRNATPSRVARVLIGGEAAPAARVGPPQRSTSDLGTLSTATPLTTAASVSSVSGVRKTGREAE